MARGDTAARMIRLYLLLLDGGALSVEAAAQRLECTTRTVYRDLEGLERNGFPLMQEKKGKQVRWRLMEGYKRQLSVQLSAQEAVALVAGERFLSALEGSAFHHGARNAVAKVRHALDPTIRARVDALVGRVSATMSPPRKLAPHRAQLDEVLEAIECCEVFVLRYRKLDAPRANTYTVEPHYVHMQGASVYVIGWARERGAPRIFLLDRIEALDRTGETFTRRQGLGPGVFAQGAFGLWDGPDELVRLRFKGSAARIVAEQEFHPTQQTVWNSDGSMTLEMTVPLSPSLRAWVRSFGKRLVVLVPQNLLEEL